MSDITDAGPRLRAMNDALQMRAEIDRLRGHLEESEARASLLELSIRRLAAQDATLSVCDGNVTVQMDGEDTIAALRREVREQRLEIAALRDERKAVAAAERPSVPVEPPAQTIPPAWLARPYWVDPPSGWRYGFPRLYDPASDGDMTEWMIRNGYPEHLARQNLPCTFTAAADEELSKNDKP